MSYTNISDLVKEGNQLIIDGKYNKALNKYNESIELDNSSASLFLNRADCFLKLDKFTEAKNDSEAALKLDQNNSEAHFRLGIALFHLSQYKQALNSITTAQKLGKNNCKYWIQKCIEMISKKTNSEDEQKSIETENLKSNKIERFRTDFIQTDNFIIYTIFVKNVKKSDVSVQYEPQRFTFKFPLPTGNEISKTELLFDGIIPNECYFNVNPYKIIISLKKQKNGLWERLLKENETNENDIPGQNVTTYPTSAKRQINWDEVDKQAKEEIENEKLEGDQALNKLFSDIYSNADPDTKRAMVKSMQTSNGTCLSTNWDEVSKHDYEKDFKPPKGLEAKKYEI